MNLLTGASLLALAKSIYYLFNKLHTCMVCLSVADPDLQIRVHPDSEIRGGSRGCGSVVSKNFFQPS